jgi:adenylate kinase family enzyme
LKKVAIFGNAGGGKSTLASRLSSITGLPLHTLDLIEYRVGGGKVPIPDYLLAHANILSGERWIIDGFGNVASAWERFDAADTLVYVDLPLYVHYLWVTKRLIRGIFVAPEGWPQHSPIWKGSFNSYRVLGLCHQRLTPRYRELVAKQAPHKRVHHLKSVGEIKTFLQAVRDEYANRTPQ